MLGLCYKYFGLLRMSQDASQLAAMFWILD